MDFLAVVIISVIVFATRLTKELSFDWFKSHSPLYKSL